MNNDKGLIRQRIMSAPKCSRCCVPVGYSGISFHNWKEQLLCDDCFALIDNEPDRNDISDKAKSLFASIKGSGQQYDAIFAYSGGKDSTVALYSAVKEYGLNVLVFNYDNGFKGHSVIDNIQRVVCDLGVDFYQIKSKTRHTIVEDINQRKLPCGRCSALKKLYPQLASIFHVKYIITGIECIVNNEAIRDRGTFYQINWPAALNWTKEEINNRIKDTPWEDPKYGLFDTDCLCPSIAIEKIYCSEGNSNFDMYMGKCEDHVVPYYSRLVRFGVLSKEDFYDIICGDLTTSDSVKQEFDSLTQNILKK